MRVWNGHKFSTGARAPRAVVTIGMFDGVHLGHQRLIRTTVQLAKRLRALSVVITFHPDPQRVLEAEHAPPQLMSLERRLRLIEALGADVTWVIPFTRAFSRLSPDAFVRRVLLGPLKTVGLVVGTTFAFGRDRRGDLALLRRVARREGMHLRVLPPVTRGQVPVSSSRIRSLLREGHWRPAAQLLGHPVELSGRVVRGAGRGARLGFPTANIAIRSPFGAPRGVYAVEVLASSRRWPGVMNVGTRPTFGNGPLVCEVHLPGFRGALYGRSVTVLLGAKLREERRFRTSEALVRQIHRDLHRASRIHRS